MRRKFILLLGLTIVTCIGCYLTFTFARTGILVGVKNRYSEKGGRTGIVGVKAKKYSSFRYNLKRLSPGHKSLMTCVTHSFVGPNIRVNEEQQTEPFGLLGRSEVSIAANQSGSEILVGWNDVEGFLRPPFNDLLPGPSGLSGYAFSSDSGLTWTDGGAPPVIDHILTAGDPWMDRGGERGQTYFFSNLAIDDRLPPIPELGVSIHRGHFDRHQFVWDDVRLIRPPTPGDVYDKGVLTAAKNQRANVYLSVTNFRSLCNGAARGRGRIELWRSEDGGDLWQGPAIVAEDRNFNANPADRRCGSNGILQHESMPAIGVDNEVYVVWEAGPTFIDGQPSADAEILFSRSFDGGRSFEPPRRVASINSMFSTPPAGYNRTLLNDIVGVAVILEGRFKGRVLVVYASAVTPVISVPQAQSLTSSQIFLSYSDDSGTTFSDPIPLGPAVPETGVKRFWPVISVTAGGVVNVVYLQSEERQATADPNDIECHAFLDDGSIERIGPISSLVDTYWVRSEHGGRNFEAPIRISSTTSNWCAANSNIFPNFGDYIATVAARDRLLSVWSDGRNGVPDVFFARLLPRR